MAASAKGIESASGVDINSTIGDMLDRQVERYADRDALVHFETGARYTYSQFRDDGGPRGPRADGTGRGTGAPRGHLVHQLQRVGADPVCHRQGSAR